MFSLTIHLHIFLAGLRSPEGLLKRHIPNKGNEERGKKTSEADPCFFCEKTYRVPCKETQEGRKEGAPARSCRPASSADTILPAQRRKDQVPMPHTLKGPTSLAISFLKQTCVTVMTGVGSLQKPRLARLATALQIP